MIKHYMRKKRIPIIPLVTEYPYLLAFDHFSPKKPTRHEVRVLAAFLDYLKSPLSAEEYSVMQAREYDLVMTYLWKPIIFRKSARDDWGVRRQTPSQPHYWPPRSDTRLSLVQLLDEASLLGENESSMWQLYKRSRADVFG